MMSWFRREPEPIQHPTFGRLEWRKTLRGGYWAGRLVFPPAEVEIAIAIPGGRAGPDPAEVLWRKICEAYPVIQTDFKTEAAGACADAKIAFGIPKLDSLHFFEASATQGEWKFIYRMGGTEIHADGAVQEIDSVFVVDEPHSLFIVD